MILILMVLTHMHADLAAPLERLVAVLVLMPKS